MGYEEIILTLSVALGASWCAGVNLYATVFVLGALSRWTSFDLPGDLAVLESHWVLWPALAMYTIEFFADKFPAVDTAWDSIHTFIRIPAGAALAATALGEVPLELQVLAGLIGGTLATTSHTAKATTRLVAHSTATSPIVSPVASVVEDITVVGLLAFVVANPLMSLGILAILVVASAFIVWTFWKLAKLVISRTVAFFSGDSTMPTPA
jgi:hypothetical protein